MKLTINGEVHESCEKTLGSLLRELNVQTDRVAVEVNYAIVRKVDFNAYILHEDDVIEVVNFVGGG
ncbi:MAG TPA: sulfur carrier protein ThiS [Dissulfurispiraceae bacterium]|nr:sulfur carrier protein ThiS [Dissulfurispiraceae bacterium]